MFVWLNNNLLPSNFQQELRGHLETCLMEGTTLVVTDVDVNDLEIDRRFHFILRSRYRFLTSTAPFKLMVSFKKAKERKATGSNRTAGARGRDCRCSVFSSSLSSSNSSSALSLPCCYCYFMLSFLFAWKCNDYKWSCWIRYRIFIVALRIELANLISRMLFYKSGKISWDWTIVPICDCPSKGFSLALLSRRRLHAWHHTLISFQVGEHEIECQPGFRLVEALVLASLGRLRFSVYLSAIRKLALLVCKIIIVVARLVMAATFPCQAVPASIAAYVNVVEFSQSRDGLEEMFLDRFLRLEKPRMQDSRTQVVDVSQGKNFFFPSE